MRVSLTVFSCIVAALAVSGVTQAADVGGTSVLLVKGDGNGGALAGATYSLSGPRFCTAGTTAAAAIAGAAAAAAQQTLNGPDPVVPAPVAPIGAQTVSPADVTALRALADEAVTRVAAFDEVFWTTVEPFLQDGPGADVTAATAALTAARNDLLTFLFALSPTISATAGLGVNISSPADTAINSVISAVSALAGADYYGPITPTGGGDASDYLAVNLPIWKFLTANLAALRAIIDSGTGPDIPSNIDAIVNAEGIIAVNAAAVQTAYQGGYNQAYFDAIDAGACPRTASVVTGANGDGTTGVYIAFELDPAAPAASTVEVRQSLPLFLPDVAGASRAVTITAVETVAPPGYQLVATPESITMGGADLDTVAIGGAASWSLASAAGPVAVVTQTDPAVVTTTTAAPTTTAPTTVAATTSPTMPPPGRLPATGSRDASGLAALAGASLLLGAATVMLARRRPAAVDNATGPQG